MHKDAGCLGLRCGVPPRQTQTDNDASGCPQRVAGRLHRTAPTDAVTPRHLKLTTLPRVTLGSEKNAPTGAIVGADPARAARCDI